MNEKTVRISLSKTTQEQPYEPFKIEVETIFQVKSSNFDHELTTETEKLEEFIENFIENRLQNKE